MAQLTSGHHGVHFTCFWGPVSVCGDHESLSGTFRGSALPGCYGTPSAFPPTFLIISLQQPVLLRGPAVSSGFFSTEPSQYGIGIVKIQRSLNTPGVIFVKELMRNTYQLFLPQVILSQ